MPPNLLNVLEHKESTFFLCTVRGPGWPQPGLGSHFITTKNVTITPILDVISVLSSLRASKGPYTLALKNAQEKMHFLPSPKFSQMKRLIFAIVSFVCSKNSEIGLITCFNEKNGTSLLNVIFDTFWCLKWHFSHVTRVINLASWKLRSLRECLQWTGVMGIV